MKEIFVDNINFKVREFLPYSELDKLNLYGLIATQMRVKKYADIFPKKEENEDDAMFTARIESLINENEIQIPDKDLIELTNAIREIRQFNRKIDDLLIVSPKLMECRPTTINHLTEHEEYVKIRAIVQEDLQSLMNPKGEQSNQTKKA